MSGSVSDAKGQTRMSLSWAEEPRPQVDSKLDYGEQDRRLSRGGGGVRP